MPYNGSRLCTHGFNGKERYCKKHFFGGSANPKSYTRWRKATASEIQNVKKDVTTN